MSGADRQGEREKERGLKNNPIETAKKFNAAADETRKSNKAINCPI